MKNILRNIVAVIVGFIAGGFVNMGLIMVSGAIIPPPAGADLSTMEGIKAAQGLLEPKHFIFPFLAHALGTFVSALTASVIAVSYKFPIAFILGLLGLLGGVAAALMIPAPTWFIVLDLIFAYLPMAWLGWKIAGGGGEKVL